MILTMVTPGNTATPTTLTLFQGSIVDNIINIKIIINNISSDSEPDEDSKKDESPTLPFR